jgi:hypothetical protein
MLKTMLIVGAAVMVSPMMTATAFAADDVSPGHAQLASQAQVNAGDYTVAEIAAILDARAEGDAETEAYILSHGNREAAEPVEVVTQGEKQIAASLGVDATKFSLAELAAIKTAREEGDDAGEAFVLSHANRAEANSAEVVTAGEFQIAASLGVDPAEYTLAELSVMASVSND